MGTEKRQRQKAGRQTRRAQAEAAARKARTRSAFIKWGIFAIVVLAIVIGFSVFAGDDDDDSSTETAGDTSLAPTTTTEAPPSYGTTPCPPPEGVAEPQLEFPDSFQQCIDPNKNYTAVFDTTEGEIRVTLDAKNTPITVNNFVALARSKYYDGTQIFRTDPSIAIIQGGSPHTNSASDPGPGYRIPDEGSGYTYEPGQIVMARTNAPDSAGAQFFFVAGAQASSLNSQGTYVVFGKTDDAGLQVIKNILALHEPDPSSQLGGSPSRPVVVNSVRIIEG